jgi:hypothetical protein
MSERSFSFVTHSGIEVLEWPWLAELGASVMITTRSGGVSTGPYDSLNLGLHVDDEPASVAENRSRVARALRCPLDDTVFAQQVHGTAASVVGAAERGRGAHDQSDAIEGTDALVTADPGVVLAMLMADCLPVVLFDPGARVIANVHAGWRGTVAGVVPAAIDAMCRSGSRPSDVLAFLGPAVDPDRYQVGEDVRDAVAERFGPDHDDVLWAHEDGRWRLDLWEANRRMLENAGLAPEQILVARVSTGQQFFSDRAMRPCGRFACLARLLEP